MTNMIELILGGNKVTDEIPYSLGNLHALEELDLSSNKLKGLIPRNFTTGLEKLKMLSLNNNHLFGAIPEFEIQDQLGETTHFHLRCFSFLSPYVTLHCRFRLGSVFVPS